LFGLAIHKNLSLYQPDPRYSGQTKWNYWDLWDFALEGITSFSVAPLKVATYVGLLTALAAFIYAWVIIYQTLCMEIL